MPTPLINPKHKGKNKMQRTQLRKSLWENAVLAGKYQIVKDSESL